MRKNSKLFFLTASVLLLMASCSHQALPPKPYGPIPSADQVAWNKMGYYMFVHFGPNTFTDREWGTGKENPKVFDPKNVDCEQWAATAKAAGMKGIVLTSKHHDGFCLWPSKYSAHTVRESAWKNGKGDLLKQLSLACKKYGLKFGVYLSPWDRNHPAYGTPAYNQVYANMLKEVLGNYGDVFELWFDGACGEGPNGKQQVYDWNLFHKTALEKQPHLMMFSDVGPSCRWGGNERGVAGETNWARLNTEGYAPGKFAPSADTLNRGNIAGKHWVPSETDVSIRPGWFYSPETDSKVKTVDQLMDIYYTSRGRNSNLILNVPPDRSGRINRIDSVRLMEFRAAREKVFASNLIKGAVVRASDSRGDNFPASAMVDDDYDTYWAASDGVNTANLIVDLKGVKMFNRLLLQEYIPLGQRIARFSVDYWDKHTNQWAHLVSATTIGFKRILRFPAVSAQKIRINIEKSLACPTLNNLGLYMAPEVSALPVIERDAMGLVHISANKGDSVFYSLDGTTPSRHSLLYTKPFALDRGGLVQVLVCPENRGLSSQTVSSQFGILTGGWTVISPSLANAQNIFDGKVSSFIHVPMDKPLVVDMKKTLLLKGFLYTPSAVLKDNIYRYDLFVSVHGKSWVKVKSNASFDNIKNNPISQEIRFDRAMKARYLKLLVRESALLGSKCYAIAEISGLVK